MVQLLRPVEINLNCCWWENAKSSLVYFLWNFSYVTRCWSAAYSLAQIIAVSTRALPKRYVEPRTKTLLRHNPCSQLYDRNRRQFCLKTDTNPYSWPCPTHKAGILTLKEGFVAGREVVDRRGCVSNDQVRHALHVTVSTLRMRHFYWRPVYIAASKHHFRRITRT